ncbi:GGDEF domain-containing phosphodiesterase [Micromonospora sp. WMMD714]|uniref:EAL domain-containing protein n=1 Tax=Micromonospora sp. WMMD714 TaxID=3016097 RepID=UPI00249C5839|nr:GGDEF domain-containing phosphodiesterase [Micromonospora sp. WMMD714]WFE63394.1 EAL domain-containing protein [Micromonospora sp. WMMD714]
MELDDILALAETSRPSPLELARARRVARAAQGRYDSALADGHRIFVDSDLYDPLTEDVDEATRVSRAARSAKQGTVTWTAGAGGRPGSGRLCWSDEMAMIFGQAPGTLHLTPETLLRLVHPADVDRVRRAVRTAWERIRPDEIGFRVIHPGGSVRHVRCHLEILTTAGRASGIIATGEDVTAQELARQERRRIAVRNGMLCADLAVPDPVTGLPTRGYLIDEVDRARRSTGGALVVVATEPATRLPDALTDDDHDEVAAAVARLLRTTVGDGVTCGLVGSGLWGVLLGHAHAGPEAAETLAATLVDTFRRHLFGVHGRTLRLNTWAGLVHFGSDVPDNGFDLLVDGEHAARDARRSGTPVVVLDQPVDAADRTARCRSRVRRAVSTDSFTLYAQPIVDLRLNQVTRHEILLRVRNDIGEPTAPWAFLDMAERVGEILAVDKWVIDHALALIGRGAQTSHYQINVSGKSLADPGLLDFVNEAIRRHRVKPECLTFEITETALIENRNEALAFATGIRQTGCHLALDDFGTGYGALTHVKYLPVDLVKIDGMFVVNLCHSPADQAVVSKLTELCHTLGIHVAAEYVQDEGTLELLRSWDVDFAQGYRTGRPEPIAVTPKHQVQTIEFELRLPPQYTAMG